MNTKIKGGIIGGIVGGVVFGMLMQMMGMMPMIAMMVGSESVLVGWSLHLVISAVTGALFVYMFGSKVSTTTDGVRYGLIYGLIWWVLGPLVIMPVILGMGIQIQNAFGQMQLISLTGHIIFGVIVGVIVAKYQNNLKNI